MTARAAAVLLLVVWLAGALTSPLCAQPATARGTLVRVAVAVGLDNTAHVVLQADVALAVPQIIGNGSTSIVVNLPNVRVPPQLPLDYQGRGNVQDVTLRPQPSAAMVVITLKRPARASVRKVGALLVLDIADTGAADSAAPASEPPSGESTTVAGENTEVIMLKYADVSEIAGALVSGSSVPNNDTFTPNPSEFGNTLGTFSGVAGQQTNVGPTNATASSSLAQRLNANIAVDRRLNAVILTGSPAVLGRLKSVIAALDIPVRSVLLETKVIELSESAARAVGIDFTNASGQLATASLIANTGDKPQILANFQAAVLAQVTSGKGRMLANPSILAQSGQPASILTGDAIPVITTITFPGSSTFTQTQVQYVNVGVDLQIQPRVTDDGYVTAHIFSQVSSVTAYVQGVPQISQRRASTSATVRDGQPFIIGGLLQDDELKSLQKIPFLGDLPLIGGLFRVARLTSQKTNLYIMVTPHVTRS